MHLARASLTAARDVWEAAVETVVVSSGGAAVERVGAVIRGRAEEA
jgi:hypothetical protein